MAVIQVQPAAKGQSARYTSQDLVTYATSLQTELGKLVNLEVIDRKAATDKARLLGKVAEEFRDAICRLQNDITTLEDLLEGREIPFPFAYRMIEILTKPEIQCFHLLKKELSKTLLIFLEFVIFQSGIEGQRFYKETIEEMKKRLQMVLTTLPKVEVETHFNIKCAEAAVQKLDKGIGERKEVFKDHRKELLGGLIKALLYADRPGPAIASFLVGPFINLSSAIYDSFEENWYQDVWALRWYCGGNRITTKAHLEAAKPLMRRLDSLMQGINYYLSFCISQIFIQIFQNPSAEESLRKAVFEEEKMSLLNLAQINLEQLGDDSFWKTRYLTLTYLGYIAKDHSDANKNYRLKSIEAILKQWFREKAEVKILAGSMIPSLARANSNEWREKWNRVKPEKTSLDNKIKELLVSRSELRAKIDLLSGDIATVQKEVKLARQPQQQSTTGGKGLDPAVLAQGLKEFEQERVSLEQKLSRLEQEQARTEQGLKLSDISIQNDQDWELFRT